MRVYFLKGPDELSTELIKTIKFFGHICFVANSTDELYAEISKHHIMPDLFIADINMFNLFLFNPFSFLASKNVFVPIIFYNDPFAPRRIKYHYWEYLIRAHFPLERVDLNKYKGIFHILSDSISIYQKNEEDKLELEQLEIENNKRLVAMYNLNNSYQTNLFQNVDSYIDKKNFSSLTGSMYLLFEILYENIGFSVSMNRLKECIKKNKTPKDSTIFCAMSKLRNYLNEVKGNPFEIVKCCDGYKMLKK